ncbi:MAG: efflux RND transporter periplasmic adaptor subunit [Dechloromonas sp.]|nr:efflux RND transporter periplasmic adaptor subunit [Dechloromonas sp.]
MPPAQSTVLALFCASLFIAGCSRPPAKEPAPPIVLVDAVISANDAGTVHTGEIRARHEFDLAFRVGGRLLRRAVDAGASIQAGQVLAELDPADLRLAEQNAQGQLAAAGSELSTARADHARQADLLARKFISQAAFDTKENALKTAQARFEQARAQAAISGNQATYGTLRSDFPALVLGTLAEPGQMLSAGQPVLRLARPGEYEVAIAIPEQGIATARQAREWQVSLPALPGLTLRAQLRELAPAADPQTRTYAARLSLHAPPAEVHLGMSARAIAVPPTTQATTPVKVALSAVIDHGQGPRVWVVSDARAHLRPVQVERFTEEGALIADGLLAGEQVVVAGTSRLTAEQAVRPQLRRPANEQR